MITYVSKYDFSEIMRRVRPENFSHLGLERLFEYLDEFEGLEFDPIAVCCDFAEYESVEDFNQEYAKDYTDYSEIDETLVLGIDSESFIIQVF